MVSLKAAAGVSMVITLTTLLLSNTVFGQNDRFSVEDLKEAIVAAISDASNLADEEPYFIVKKVELELQGTSDVGGEGGFSIPVFGFSIDLSTKIESSSKEKLELVLVPAETIVVGGKIKIDLASLIQELKATFKKEKSKSTGSKGTSGFYLTPVKYETLWTLRRNAKGGIDFVIASAGAAISEEKQQKVKFTLCETVNLTDCAEQ